MGQHTTREALEANIHTVENLIQEYNAHWLQHKHLMSAFAALVMALIFTGMLVKSIELYLWGLCGILLVVYVGLMVWRTRRAAQLNVLMAAAHEAFKEYEKGRRKRKK
ncbi:MAG: hypothetical protein OCC46_04150 [Pseudodesulfovibrio sp.]